jgi:hypothetical protein
MLRRNRTGWNWKMPIMLRPSVAAMALCLAFAAPALATDAAGPELKAEIDGLLDKLAANTHGLVKWEGADRVQIREDGNTAIADMTNARLSVGSEEKRPGAARARVTFDHFEVRKTPNADGASELSIAFPQEGILSTPDHGDTKLMLKDATAHLVIDGKSGRARESEVAFTSARIDDKPTGDWISLGAMSLSSKIITAGDGGWTGPIEFGLKGVEFFAPDGAVDGKIDHIGYTARSAGPDLAALNRLRDRIDALRERNLPPDERLDALLDMVPAALALLSEAKGELTLDGLTVRPDNGQPFVALARASVSAALTGLSGTTAALRITLKHDGLAVAPNLLDTGKVPRRAVVDFGLEDVGTGPLRTLLGAIGQMRAGAAEADKQHAQQEMIGAAAMLNPVIRVYDLAVDTPDAGVEATAEARGSPLSPKGFGAQGDVSVRGFEALTSLVGNAPPAAYLAVLKELGTAGKTDDGSPRLKFHLVATLQKWLTVNGNDVTSWFGRNAPGPDQPRMLRPAEPPMAGADVGAVQHALSAAHVTAPANGKYDGATAAAVARFQKANALNADGVVDAATREKLGIKPEPAQSSGAAKGAN